MASLFFNSDRDGGIMKRLEPVQGILTILDEAKMTGTNKLSLLLAILDLAPITPKSRLMSVDDIVEKTLELHWNHADEFSFADGVRPVRQLHSSNRDNISAVLRVGELKSQIDQKLGFEIAKERIGKAEWRKAQTELKKNLLSNPIKYLQNLPGDPPEFLFELTADKKFLRFFPGVIEALVLWGNALRPIIELHYLNFVLASNKTESHQEDLYKFLFGEERSMPSLAVRKQLWDIQKGRCIYTGETLLEPTKTRQQSLDHVVPWSRMRLSVIENFVLTNDRVNNEKRALLLDYSTLRNWHDFATENSEDLQTVAADNSWPADMGRVLQGLRALYSTPTPPIVWGSRGIIQMTERDRDRAIELLIAV